MKKIINAGVIGFGNAGQTFLAPFIDANPGFNLKKISNSFHIYIYGSVACPLYRCLGKNRKMKVIILKI